MHWLLIAYLIVLVFVAFRRDRFANTADLRGAWLFFAAIPVSYFIFALFRAGNATDARDLALIEIWSDGIAWLLLGISIYFLAGVVAPSGGTAMHFGSAPPPASPTPPERPMP